MLTIGSKVSQRELEAIVEDANLCDETVSNLLRKLAIREATFLNCGFQVDDNPEYETEALMPSNIPETEVDKVTESNVNKKENCGKVAFREKKIGN